MKENIAIRIFGRAGALLEEIIFPPHCISCGLLDPVQSGGYDFLCAKCFREIPVRSSLVCPMCGRRVIFDKHGRSAAHQSCRRKMPFFLAAATNYDDIFVREIIHTYKYKGVKSFSVPLADLLIRHVASLSISGLSTYSIVPVPLHPSKKKMRGFNQSELVAQRMAHKFNIPCRTDIVARTRKTKTQANISDPEQRKQNINGCFSVTNPGRVAGKNFIVLDDIYTSGSTMTEMVQTLRQAGARRIIGAVIAKT